MKDSLKSYIGNIEFIDLKAVDIAGRLRHVILPGERLTDDLFTNGVGFDASNFGYATVEDSDMIMIPDPDTAFIDPFYELETLSFFCDVLKTSDRKPFMQYPRNILKSTVELLSNFGANEAMLGPELEFHVFESMSYNIDTRDVSYSVDVTEGFWNCKKPSADTVIEKKRGYHRCPPADALAGFRNEAAMLMKELGVPVKYHHHEVSSAQHEFELLFQGALKSADSIVIAKYILQNLANDYGLTVTFMPKPLFGEAGNGMHIHQYLVDSEGKNIFSGDGYCGLSELALSYTAGILEHSLTGSLLSFTNPSTSSYRRLVPGFEAPICGVFARGNRSAAVRIPGYVNNAKKTRIEYRTIDASCNPYYGIAAMLLSGIDGIERKLDPTEMGYGPIDSNMYSMSEEDKKKIRFFPTTLRDTLNGLTDDKKFLLKVFPEELIEKWRKSRLEEADYVNSVPSPAEYKLYFDL